MGKKSIIMVTLILFCAAGLMAGSVPDVIQMDNKAYSKHKKGIASFTHAKHVNDYKIGCGECHHDDKGTPLTALKEGDSVQGCIECHPKPGQLKGKKAKGLSKAEKLQYHANAVHDNCIKCHRAYNKKNKTKAAPYTCKKCHPKK